MKLIYKIVGGILLLAIFSAFLFSLYKGDIEKSNLTDWISAFCNMAMAAAALGGYFIAKDWKGNALREKFLPHAIDFKVNGVVKVKDSCKAVQESIDIIKPVFMFEGYIPTRINNEFLEHMRGHVTDLEKSISDLVTSTSHLYEYHESISALGYKLKERFAIDFNKICTELDGNISNLKGHCFTLRSLIAADNAKLKYDIDAKFISHNYSKLFSLIIKSQSQSKKIEEMINDFVRNKGTALDFFEY